MFGVLNGGRLGEAADCLRKARGIVGHFYSLRNLWLRQPFGMDDRVFIFHLLPFNALFTSCRIETFAVLTRRVEKAAGHLGHDVGPLDFESRRLQRKGAVVSLDELLPDST